MKKEKQKEFEMLVKQNMKRAYFSALGLLGDYDLAMEASQAAFVKAYRHFSKFDKSKKFYTWYYKILRNLCLNMIRDKKKFIRNIETVGNSILEYKESNISKNIEEEEIILLLHDAIDSLDQDEREILNMREFNNFSYKEISELLDIPVGTVMSRLYYSRKKLAEKMRKALR